MNYFAKLHKRGLAALIDHAVFFTIAVAYVVAFGVEDGEEGYAVHGWATLPLIIFWFIYFPLIEGLTGQTLGKKLMGTRVASVNDRPVGIGQSILRHVFDAVDLMFFGLVGALLIGRTEKRQRVGDLIAGTIVMADHPVPCDHCGTEWMLSRDEYQSRKFHCQHCGKLNELA